MWRAALLCHEFTLHIGGSVLLKRRAWISALLRAIVNQTFFADIKVTSAGATSPLVGLAVGDIVLEVIEARIILFLERLDLKKYGTLFIRKRLQLAVSVMNDANRRGKAKLQRTAADNKRIVGVLHTAADHRVDVYVEVGMFREQLQFLIENLQALLRHVIGIHVVDTDLQMI